MSNVIYVTKEGLKKLEGELVHLKDVARVEVAEKLKEAISFGDLSENSEYEEARNLQSQVEVRIRELESQLKNIEIINEDVKDASKVNMGDIIELSHVESGESITYKLVGTTESDILAEIPKISNESIIGKAILGKKKGSTVKMKANAGDVEYKILNIS